MSIDILVCTHNRGKNLVDTLRSLKKMNGDFKVIVLDSSDEPIAKEYQKFADRYIHLGASKKSLSSKRNMGIKMSKADFIAFTDDDCLADKNWIVELLRGMNGVECCTGKTVPYIEKKDAKFEKMFSFGKLGDKERIIKKKVIFNLFRIGHGNNMIFKRKIFDEIGLYDENLGVGSKGLAGEDLDIFYKILKKGYKIRYNPHAIIYHNHLVKDEEVPKTAYRNSFAAHELFLKKANLTYVIFYFLLFIKYSFKYIFGDRKVEKQRLRGILGMSYTGD